MTVSLFWRIRTADFDSWLNPNRDALGQMFQSQGVLSVSLHGITDDPNSVVVHMQFADRGAVDAFEAWYGPMAKVLARATRWQRARDRRTLGRRRCAGLHDAVRVIRPRFART